MTLRIGMIGPGGMGKAHIERIHTVISGGRVVAVSDVNPDNAAAVAEQIGGTAFATSAELIASPDVDAIMIASYGPAHKPDVIAAVEAGKYVFCEKPLAFDHGSAQAMTDAVERAGVVNQVGLVLRHAPVFNLLKDLVEDPASGRLMSVVFRDDQ